MAPAVDLWPGIAWSEDKLPRLVQGGHTVFFCGTEEEVRVVPTICSRSGDAQCQKDAPLRPAAPEQEALGLKPFLDIAPVSPWEFIGVTGELVLECWRLRLGCGAERVRCQQTHLQRREPAENLRLFLEHVAARLFLFYGASVLAFELNTLELLYTLGGCGGQPAGSGAEVELLARWDYGRAFLVYLMEGSEVSVWSSADGRALGAVGAREAMLCCDLSHGVLAGGDSPVLATLEVDGRVRTYRRSGGNNEWLQLGMVDLVLPESSSSVFVEVKLEGLLLMAVSHSEDGLRGAVHVWDLGLEGASAYRSRHFASAPDRVEARHGGSFVEVCLTVEDAQRLPQGVFDVRWLDHRDAGLRELLALDGAMGDWRCDVRDSVALVEEGTMLVRQISAWQPLGSH